jgi:cyanophycin synthetase
MADSRDASLLAATQGTLAQHCPIARLAVEEMRIFPGPYPPVPCPAIVARIRTGDGLPTLDRIDERILALLPQDFEPVGDAAGKPADAEAIAARIAMLSGRLLGRVLGMEVASGSSGSGPGEASCWVEQIGAPIPGLAVRAALVAVGAALAESGTDEAITRQIEAMLLQGEKGGPAITPRVMIAAARRRDIPFLRIGEGRALWQYGWGRRSLQFYVTSSNADGMAAQRIASDKNMTKQLMRDIGIPTPDWRLVGPGEDPAPAASAIGWPCVVKPNRGGGGDGVTASIDDEATLERAAGLARNFASHILVEAHLAGDDHRLMVIDGRLFAALRREPPSIVGDGTSSVAALLEVFNRHRQPRRGFLKPVYADESLALTLASQGLGLESILPEGRRALLRTAANVSTGGHAIDVLDSVHPEVKLLAEQLAIAGGLRATGIDYVTPDITRSPDDVGGGFIETNTTAGIDVLLVAGIDRDRIGSALLGENAGRIPVRLLLAPEDAWGEAIEIIASRPGSGAALVTTTAIQLDGNMFTSRDLDPDARVRAALRYPNVASLTILWDVATLCRHGLPVDKVDELTILGPPPPDEWLALLESLSGTLRNVEDVAALAGTGRGGKHRTR